MVTDESGGGASLSTDPAAGTSAATDVSLREHIEALRRADLRFADERDRRYTEIQAERDKAEIIRAANQAYRDEKANELREQISTERGLYVSQTELKAAIAEITATLRPIIDYISSQQGARTGALDQRTLVAFGIATALGIWALVQALM